MAFSLAFRRRIHSSNFSVAENVALVITSLTSLLISSNFSSATISYNV